MARTLVEVLMVADFDSRPSFTVDTNVNEVALVPGDGIGRLVDAVQSSLFQRMDSVTILEMGIFLPYQFGLGASPVIMSLSWHQESGVNVNPVNRTWIPGACAVSFSGGASAGQFLEYPSIASPLGWPNKAKLGLKVVAGTVSMINVPEDLTGTFYAIPWVRVQHNLDMLPEA